MVSAFDFGSRDPGSSPGRVIVSYVFLGKTLYSHSAFVHPGVNGYQQTVRQTWQNAGRLPAMDKHPIQEE